jgi:membrane-associated phospholipid phosphatase
MTNCSWAISSVTASGTKWLGPRPYRPRHWEAYHSHPLLGPRRGSEPDRHAAGRGLRLRPATVKGCAVSTILEQVESSPQSRLRRLHSFDLWMANVSGLFLAVSAAVCIFTSARVDHVGSTLVGLGVTLAMVAALPLYWHEKRRPEMRDAALTIPWILLLAVILPIPVDAGARLAFPLQDIQLMHADHALGVSVPGIMTWAARHWPGRCINRTYQLLMPLLAIAAILPALTGKVQEARRFLFANLLAFIIGVPLFTLMPAIGPWYGYHLETTPLQMKGQADLLALRVSGPYSIHPAGIVCFPSFHVIWAILCTVALSGFKPLRVPVCILSGLIILSTMTTGWHYFSDVLAGAAIAAVAAWLPTKLIRSADNGRSHLRSSS